MNMGTRADFYTGQGPDAVWLGSVAWDGYPEGCPYEVVNQTTLPQYLAAVKRLIKEADHSTHPSQGWPWPWEDSRTTDYAYTFDENRSCVMASCFGRPWFVATEEEPDDASDDPTPVFPDMTSIQKIDYGTRSGLIVIGE